MERLLVATTNRHKLAEIRAILGDAPAGTIVGLDALAGIAAPEETGSTFAENARAKALFYAAASGLPTVAEDSGLEVDALGGAPGVLSARFGSETSSYPEKFERIYAMLRQRGAPGSTARFVCALALADRATILFEAVGTIEGRIAPEPRGRSGFGYDPVFFYPPFGRTLAEVSAEQKASVSHRGEAFRKLAEYLRSSERRVTKST
jgi:XTP/dITP diphosphohydrolase